MDSRVERIVPRSVFGVKPKPERTRDEKRKQKRFQLDGSSKTSKAAGKPSPEVEPRSVSGRDEGEAGGQLNLTA